VHRVHGELPPERAAAEYERALRLFFGDGGLPRFDLILLGLGEDGHTASLFPGSAALDEVARWAVAVPHSSPPPPLLPRVSLTLPVLNAAAQVVFLVSGAGKAERLAQVLTGPGESLPAGRVHPTAGGLLWLVDRAAARALKETDEHRTV
jgi:6-phosphogluconolactonase